MDEGILGRAIEYHGPDFLRQLQLEQQSVPPNSFLHLQRHRPMVPEINDLQFNLGVRKFIAKKAHILFTPVNKVKDANRNILDEEDCYAKMPPLETFMGVDPNTCRAHLYKSLQVGDVLVCVVTGIMDSGLILNLLCLDHGKNRDIDDLRISAFVPVKEIPKMFPTQNPVEGYQVKDYIRGVVISLSPETENIILSLMESALVNMEAPRPTLGLVHEEDFPVEFRRKLHIRGLTFDELLSSICGFTNPGNVPYLLGVSGQAHNASIMAGLANLKLSDKEYADYLKKTQSQKWAYKSVAEGIALFKEGKQTEAMQQLNKALQIDPQNVEALVARGALYANNESFSKALEDFEEAISHNPKHPNGIKYMHDTLLAKGKCHEDEEDWDKAEKCYSRALEIVPRSDEAQEYLRYVQYKKESKGGGRKDKEGGDLFQETADTLRRLIKEDSRRTKKGSKYERDSSDDRDGRKRSRSPGRSQRRRSSSSSSSSRSGSSNRNRHKSDSAKKKRYSRDESHSRSRSPSKTRSKRSRSSRSPDYKNRDKKSEGDSLYDPSQPTEQTESSKYWSRSRDEPRSVKKEAEQYHKRSIKKEPLEGHVDYHKVERIPFLSDSPPRSAGKQHGDEAHTPTKDEVNDRLGLEDISPELYGNTEDRRLRHLDRKISVEPKQESSDWSRHVKVERTSSDDDWEAGSKLNQQRESSKKRSFSPSDEYRGKERLYGDEKFDKYRKMSPSPDSRYKTDDYSSHRKKGYEDTPDSYSRRSEEMRRSSTSKDDSKIESGRSMDHAGSRSPEYGERRVISVTRRDVKDKQGIMTEKEEYLSDAKRLPSSDRYSEWSSRDQFERRSIVVSSRNDQSRDSSMDSKFVDSKRRASKSRASQSKSPEVDRRRSISVSSHSKSKRHSRHSLSSDSNSESRSRSRSRRKSRSHSRDGSRSRSYSRDKRKPIYESPDKPVEENEYKRVIQVSKKKPDKMKVEEYEPTKAENSIYTSGKWKTVGQTDSKKVSEQKEETKDTATSREKQEEGSKQMNMFTEESKTVNVKRLENQFATYVPRSVKLKQHSHMNPEKEINPEEDREQAGTMEKERDRTVTVGQSPVGKYSPARNERTYKQAPVEQRVVLKINDEDLKNDPRFKHRHVSSDRKKYRSPDSETRKKYKRRSRSRSYDKYKKRSRSRSRDKDNYRRRSRSQSYDRYKRKSKRSRSRSASYSKSRRPSNRSGSRSSSEERKSASKVPDVSMPAVEIPLPKVHSRWDSPEEKKSRWEENLLEIKDTKARFQREVSDARATVASMLAASLISSSPPPHRKLKPEEKKAMEEKWKALEEESKKLKGEDEDEEKPIDSKPKTIEQCIKEAKATIEKHLLAAGKTNKEGGDKDKKHGSTDNPSKVKGLRSRWDDSSSSSRSISRSRSRSRSKDKSRSRDRRHGSSSDEDTRERSHRSRERQRSRWDSGDRGESDGKRSKDEKDEQRVFWFHKKEVLQYEHKGRGGRGRTRGRWRGNPRFQRGFGYRGANKFNQSRGFRREESPRSSSRSRSPETPRSRKKDNAGSQPQTSNSRADNHSGDGGVGAGQKPTADFSELESFYNKLKEDKKKQMGSSAKPGPKL